MKKLFLLLFALCTLPSMAQQPTAYDVKLKNKLHMRVTVCTDGIFRVQVAPRSQFAENLMLRYGVQNADWAPVNCQTQDKGGIYTITTPKHVLAVDKKDGTLRIADKQGRAIIDRVSFVDGKQPLTTQLGKSINEKYADLKVAKNDGIIGDNSNPKTAKDTVETQLVLTPEMKMGVGLTSLLSYYEPVKVEYGFFESFPAGTRYGINILKGYVNDMKYVFSTDGVKSLGGFGAIGSLFPPTWDWHMFWMMTAFLSIILAFMNLLPIPALDGGHVLFLLYEMITRRKPSENFMIWAEYIGIGILVLLMVVANLNDVLRFIGIMD